VRLTNLIRASDLVGSRGLILEKVSIERFLAKIVERRKGEMQFAVSKLKTESSSELKT
jgi:hypothetical protein